MGNKPLALLRNDTRKPAVRICVYQHAIEFRKDLILRNALSQAKFHEPCKCFRLPTINVPLKVEVSALHELHGQGNDG